MHPIPRCPQRPRTRSWSHDSHDASNRRQACAAVVLLGWIVIETALVRYVSWLQPAMAVAGLVIVRLALLLEDIDQTAAREAVRR